jgi:DNA-binding NarL/FixJ family response regulator
MSEIHVIEPSDICRTGVASILANHGLKTNLWSNIESLLHIDMPSSVIMIGVRLDTFELIESLLQKRLSAGLQGKLMCICSDHVFDRCSFLSQYGVLGYCARDISSELLLLAIKAVENGAKFICPRLNEPQYKQSSASPKLPLLAPESSPELSPRELEVLLQVAAGASNQQIAATLGISIETVKAHVKHILSKLSVTDRTQAAIKAIELGIAAGSKPKLDQS